MSRGLCLLGLALCGIADATAQPHMDLSVTPAWSAWTRPGRETELDIRLSADAATRATLDIVAGRQTVRAELELEPGRAMRLHVPVGSAESVAVSVGSPAAPPEQREVAMAQSESPLLGLGLATDDTVRLEGFHTVALNADALPRNASAYSSIDALILDAPTLGALDQRQLDALLAHTGECGRIVLLNPDPRVRRALDAARGCAGQALMIAASLADAREMLESSLGASGRPAISLAGIGESTPPGVITWNRVLVVLAAYFAVATLGVMFLSSLATFLLMPALAAVAVLALLHVIQPVPQVVIWSEGESGVHVARYRARQRFPGVVRGRVRVPVLPRLASGRSCDRSQPMRFDFDVARGRVTFAEFDTRLFQQPSLCYSGTFPLARAVAVVARPDGALDVRNAGTMAWPKGVLLAGRLVHDLPALAPGEAALIRTHDGKPVRGAVARTALAQVRTDGPAALWELELAGIADVPIDANGWLLVSLPAP